MKNNTSGGSSKKVSVRASHQIHYLRLDHTMMICLFSVRALLMIIELRVLIIIVSTRYYIKRRIQRSTPDYDVLSPCTAVFAITLIGLIINVKGENWIKVESDTPMLFFHTIQLNSVMFV